MRRLEGVGRGGETAHGGLAMVQGTRRGLGIGERTHGGLGVGERTHRGLEMEKWTLLELGELSALTVSWEL